MRLPALFIFCAAAAIMPMAMVSAKKSEPQSSARLAAAGSNSDLPAQQPVVPHEDALVILIRSSLLALSQANQTNNYAVLNALGSDNFRSTNSPARLAELFASFRNNQIDLAPVTLINPVLSQKPMIENGRLRLIGRFPTQPMQVNFDLEYEPTVAGWKLFGIAVNLNRVQQAATGNQPASR
jgi:hypothetical protein